MKRIPIVVVVMALLGRATVAVSALLQPVQSSRVPSVYDPTEKVLLPPPKYDGKVSVEQALRKRRSVREYRDAQLTLNEVSQLLWAAQGITDTTRGLRTAPSAGATYPLEVYIAVGNVEGVKQGAYKYHPHEHQLRKVRDADVRAELSAALGQAEVGKAGAIIVFFAVYERTTVKFGEVGIRYIHMEVGHAAQNVYLQATSLNLGTTVIGGFPDAQLKKMLRAPENEQPLYIMPVGRMSPKWLEGLLAEPLPGWPARPTGNDFRVLWTPCRIFLPDPAKKVEQGPGGVRLGLAVVNGCSGFLRKPAWCILSPIQEIADRPALLWQCCQRTG